MLYFFTPLEFTGKSKYADSRGLTLDFEEIVRRQLIIVHDRQMFLDDITH